MKSHPPIVLFIAAVPKKREQKDADHDEDDEAKKSLVGSPRLWLANNRFSKSLGAANPPLYLKDKR